MRKLISTGAIAAAMLTAPTALGQELGASGDLVLAADRLMGLYISDDDTAPDGFGMGLGIGLDAPYMIGRLGIDYFVIDSLSVGGNVSLIFDEDRYGDDEGFGFLLAPRVGYAIGFSDSFGIWPRGGITFFHAGDFNKFAFTVEAPLYAQLTDSFGMSFGPTLDIEVAGDGDEGIVFGLVSAGVFGVL